MKDGDIMKYERKDDMLFGQWQAQMMLDKGQSTEGIRVDKKIQVNPLFKGYLVAKPSDYPEQLKIIRLIFNVKVTPSKFECSILNVLFFSTK